MKRAKILVGVPGCGKSTLARQFVDNGYVQIERDMIRMELYGRWYGGGIDEKRVTFVQTERARRALLNNENIIISDTNINQETRDRWIKFCTSLGAEVDVIIVGQGLYYDDLVKRNAGREDQSKVVPVDVMGRFYADFREQYPLMAVNDQSKQDAFLFDIDGTMADMTGLRGPFDWAKVGVDRPYHDVIKMTSVLASAGAAVIVMSGRDEVCQAETVDWMFNNGVVYDELFMRKHKSQLRDSAVKHDLYHRYVAPRYNVVGVFDDRNQVVDMWRKIGLRCYQVQPGNF